MPAPVWAVVSHLRWVFSRSPWAADLGSALTAVGWAIVMWAAPHDMVAWPAMLVLVNIADQEAWEAAGLALGLGQFAAMAVDRRWMRWTAAVALSWFWGVLAVGVWSATPWNPATVAYAGWCAINVFSILRLLRPDVRA